MLTREGTNERRESRYALGGIFDRNYFTLGSMTVKALPIDISAHGLGLLIDAAWQHEDIRSLRLMFLDDTPPIDLEVRYKFVENKSRGLRAQTRCGLELSEAARLRGINLIEVLQKHNSCLFFDRRAKSPVGI